MKHLVTGGSGFLGNLVARRLSERGESVRVLDLCDDPTRPPGIEFVRCDIRDRAGVAAAMRGIDIVHHNVALVPLTKAGGRFRDVNVNGSRLAAQEAVRAGVKSFIHMSSSAIFGAPARCPVTAATAPRPIEAYGRVKLEAETAVGEICDRAGLPLIVIRPRTTLGVGRMGIFQILFDWIRQGRSVYVIGDGNVKFQFVHAHDLMDAYLLLLAKGASGAFNVGTDRFGTLREALENLIAHAGTSSRVRSLPVALAVNALRSLDLLGLSPLAPWHYLTYHKAFHFDVSPLLQLGWRPRYSNDEMLAESYDWFCAAPAASGTAAGASVHRSAARLKFLRLVKWLS